MTIGSPRGQRSKRTCPLLRAATSFPTQRHLRPAIQTGRVIIPSALKKITPTRIRTWTPRQLENLTILALSMRTVVMTNIARGRTELETVAKRPSAERRMRAAKNLPATLWMSIRQQYVVLARDAFARTLRVYRTWSAREWTVSKLSNM